ncbi:sensor domain-containing diguanylate cyclase [Sansalvadorimonas sp. 2012CJ34-2]|uniref:Sensor domain-containing diguanylate cyclase n=1 Tax=Parendozoicomonas callyspongiae TaxID=2942213 RepID=A0ABT0PJR2_9GAMM|nr:sensor domain-containing diguanylate cyclase [Sansalvadorimonas sp. 2012CJ34-2]MCL6271589.1 sensor domain-containing diguanylate cyclase [Sansalvadorimonas sp. 2012CJ34-2]
MILSTDSFEKIIENLHDGLYFVDQDLVITYWNKAAERISGYSSQEIVGTLCTDSALINVDSEGNYIRTCPLAVAMDDGKMHESELYLRHKKGHRIPVNIKVSPLTDDNDCVVGASALIADISNQAANTLKLKELEKLALLDNLTQLGNRNFIDKEIKERLCEFKRKGTPFGILFFDIDNFKRVNDTYGHDVGDKVLKFVADTLSSSSRPFDFYGRWGGEEFIGIIRNIEQPGLEQLGCRLRRIIESSHVLEGDNKIRVTISIGATVVNITDTEKTLIKRADTLLYQSKDSGRNCITVG